jgi:hypothetical protein
VTVSRPSGKITSVSPSLTELIRLRVPIGFVGSIACAFTSFRNGFTHACCAIAVSIANEECDGRIEYITAASSRLTWFGAMMAR